MHKIFYIVVVIFHFQDDSPQEKLPNIISDLFDKKKISFDTHNMDVVITKLDLIGCLISQIHVTISNLIF